jgi:hypothetical protein
MRSSSMRKSAPPKAEIRSADSGPFLYKQGGPAVPLKVYATSERGSFKWSDGVSTPITLYSGPNVFTREVTPSTSKVYELIGVTDGLGCSGAAYGAAQVNYCPAPPAVLSAPATVRASEIQTASVTATTGAAYTWQITNGTIIGGAATPSITFRPGCTGPVTLTAKVTSSCGAETTVTSMISVLPATATVSGTTTIAQGSSATVDVHLGGAAPWTLQWPGDASPVSVSQSPYRRIVTPVGTTSYGLTSAVDGYGCALTVSGGVIVTVKPAAPGNVEATAVSSTQIRVTWTSGAVDAFTVYRDGVPVTDLPGTARQFVDSVAAGTAHLYHLVSRYAGTASDPSARDLAAAMVFSTPELVGGEAVIAAADVLELRAGINAVRALAGLAASTWTDANLSDQAPKAIHMNEMREALAGARVALGIAPVGYWRNPTNPGHESFALDVVEIRGGIQ